MRYRRSWLPPPTRSCLRCLRRPGMFSDASLCGRCFVRSVVALLGFLLMVGGFAYALWAFGSYGR